MVMWWKVVSIWFFFTSGGLIWNCIGCFNILTFIAAILMSFVGVMFTWAMLEDEEKDKKQKKNNGL